MSNDILIELRNVGVCYTRRAGFLRNGKFWALHDVSFHLFRGETLGVIGHNGAGKSTLLRLLAGIMAPDRGELISHADRISLLSLQVGFVSALSGRQNAVLSGMLLGMTRHQVEDAMGDIIEFSGLQDFIDEPVRTYSNGMRARLGFSVAFQADPDVVLVDEVLGTGDAAFRAKSTAAMREKIASNKTVVVVTHSPATILDLCDRVAWVHHGVTVEVGDPGTIVKHYQDSVQRGEVSL